jgi:hypothetical protein
MKMQIRMLMMGIVVGTFWLSLAATQTVTAQTPQPGGTGKPPVVEDVKATDLPMGDFSLDDVEELPLPTEEEGGVQVDGKSYLPKPKYPKEESTAGRLVLTGRQEKTVTG